MKSYAAVARLTLPSLVRRLLLVHPSTPRDMTV
jgi:hypothetical protein